MRVEFDPDKDAANISKHGVSLRLAEELDWDAAIAWVDERFEYGEVRMIALAPATGLLDYVAFLDNDDSLRVLSLRRANRLEVRRYVQELQG